ncbi:MAG: arginase family protein [Deltaproteobacteria bacterium]|nr:MAG: arginase family protein [Deltaproteobacteria bacterium]
MLAPAGGGVYLFSTGKAAQRAVQRRIYRLSDDADDGAIEAAHRRVLAAAGGARVVVLGVPTDTGAGFVRGANQAPLEIRRHLVERGPDLLGRPEAADVGDVRVVPHLLADDMLAEPQIRACRAALYEDGDVALPVSPLDMASRALSDLAEIAPKAVPIVIGGDHSVGWPAFAAAFARAERQGMRLGLLHFDAHTDLLPHRLGVRICFATWAYHANELLGRDGRLVQVGIRASGRDRGHWEASLGVRQIWAEEARRRPVDDVVAEIVERFERLGVDAVYVSNDIDGTDPAFAAATGTPEPGGLSPEQVRGITRGVLARFPLWGADLVEVAPPLAHEVPGEPERTLATAAAYLADYVDAVVAG